MRVNVNLATRPYQDVGRFLARYMPLLFLVVAITIVLCWYAVFSWRQSRDVNQQIATVRREIDALNRQRASATALLNSPQNSDVAARSRFLNQLIARKAFSWTRVFMQLEEMMPPRLRVVSMAPELNPENQLELRMMVVGDARDAAVELVRRLEGSNTFRRAQLLSETTLEGAQAAGNVQFEISAIYVPQTAAVAAGGTEASTTTAAAKPVRQGAER